MLSILQKLSNLNIPLKFFHPKKSNPTKCQLGKIHTMNCIRVKCKKKSRYFLIQMGFSKRALHSGHLPCIFVKSGTRIWVDMKSILYKKCYTYNSQSN